MLMWRAVSGGLLDEVRAYTSSDTFGGRAPVRVGVVPQFRPLPD
jgi:hypothetical protein